MNLGPDKILSSYDELLRSFEEDLSNSVCDKAFVLLTGGRGAQEFYKRINNEKSSFDNKNIEIHLTDERVVSSNDPRSNKKQISDSLLGGKSRENISFVDLIDYETFGVNYQAPDYFDIGLFSVGEDGHIASLFPGMSNSWLDQDAFLIENAPKEPPVRATISPSLIKRIKNIYVLCVGEGKKQVLENCLKEPEKYEDYPARLLLKANWLIKDEL